MTGDRPESKVDAKSHDQVAGWNLLDLTKPDSKKAKAETRFVKPPVEPVPVKPPKPPIEPPKPPVEPPVEPPKPPIEPPEPPKPPVVEPPKPPVEPPKEPPKPPVEPPKPPVEPPKPPVEPPKPPVEPPVEPPKPPRVLRPSPSAFFEVPEFSDVPKKPLKPVPPLTADVPIVPALPMVPTGVPTAVQIVPETKIDAGLPSAPEQRQTSLTIQQLPEQPTPVIPTFPTPTGVFTGQGRDNARAERIYKENYSTGEHATPNHAHLVSKAIGLNVDIDLVGTGKDRGMKSHQTEMVSPKDPYHVGQWKYNVPGKTILAGHVSFKGTPGPMYELRKLGVHNGVSDTVTLESADGKKTNYVFAGRTILKDPNDIETWKKVFAPGNPNNKELVMVTCCGPVDSNGLHKWRLIVHLNEVKPQAKPEAQPAKPEAQPAKPEVQPTKPEASPAKLEAQPAKPEAQPAKPEASHAKLEAQPAKPEASPAKPEAQPAKPSADAIVAPQKTDGVTDEAAAKEAAAKEAAAKEAATPSSAEAGDATQHDPKNSLKVTTSSSGTRIRFDFNRDKNNSLTAEIGGDPGRFSYGTFGPNFSLINKDNTKLNANLRIGYGNSLMPTTELPYGGVPGLTISGQAVFGQRLGRDTTLYLGGAFGAHPGNKDIGYQLAGEAGVVQRVGRFSLRAGLQESKVDGFAATTYGIGGISYRADKNTTFDLTVHKRLMNQSGAGSRSGSDTVFFGVRHSF